MVRYYLATSVYFTKLHLLGLKKNLKFPFEYKRGSFDSILIKINKKTQVTITQDGLIVLSTDDTLSQMNKWYLWLKKNVISLIPRLDNEDIFHSKVLAEKEPVVLVSSKKVDEAFSALNRVRDYSFSSKHFSKHYGQGLMVYDKLNVPKHSLEDFIHIQVFLADYQISMDKVIEQNKEFWNFVSSIRKKKQYRYHQLPKIIDELLDRKRILSALKMRIKQLGTILVQRKNRCTIHALLKEVKIDDFDEMLQLNSFVLDQLTMSYEYVTSSIELIDFIYKETEQKEFNILQVIFAIGTIAAIVSLGAMPGAKLFLEKSGDGFVGKMVSFSPNDFLFWSVISVIIGLVLFFILNYLFFSAKKFRIVQLVKTKGK